MNKTNKVKYFKSTGNTDYIYRVHPDGHSECHALSKDSTEFKWVKHIDNWDFDLNERWSSVIIIEMTEAEVFTALL